MYKKPITEEDIEKALKDITFKAARGEKPFVVGRYCKVRGLIMDDGTLGLCSNPECLSCSEIRTALQEHVRKLKSEGSPDNSGVKSNNSTNGEV